MSLFGASKLATTSSAPIFSFGTASSSTANKPVFGTTTTQSSLFNASVVTTVQPSLFGTAVATTTQPSLFGMPTATTTQPSLFGSINTTSSQFSLFGNTSTTSASSQPGGLFAPKMGTATGILSSSKPGGIFSTQTSTQQAPQFSTVQDLIQNSEYLIRSLTSPDLFGDERDGVVAKLNQLLAACGIGDGYHSGDQKPVAYNMDNPFYQFKAVGYSRRSDYADIDGIVALTLGINYEQLSTVAQRQKFIDSMNIVLGNNTNVRCHIELIRPLPDNQTEVLLYVIEKGKGRPSSKELCAYLKQPTQETQLKNHFCVVTIVPRTTIDGAKKDAFVKNPPPGFDAQVWQQAVRENPDPEKLLPYPIRGFEQLRKRQDMQAAEIRLEERVFEDLKQRISKISNELNAGKNVFSYRQQRHKELSHRLLRCLAMQSLLMQYTLNIDDVEENLETRLEALNASIIGPQQIKSRITNLLAILHDESETLKVRDCVSLKLTEKDIKLIKNEDVFSICREKIDDKKVLNFICMGL
ncbi:unnamed protein product [Thelazia callipaeda]|uniref:Nup54 domain-containing protein n=1 Tax=Thelazia callipaeda TaxID=103827 RepID=A0A158RBE4_THECL|nr:unnamed protein product [Thelazia callipaeda]